jgi:hypothetical protein
MTQLVPKTRRTARWAMAAATVATFAAGVSIATAADHRDGSTSGVQAEENIAADINDVYAFMTTVDNETNNKVVLGMTVFPAATANSEFSDAALYVFHVNRHANLLAESDGEVEVVCSFETDQTISCWIGDELVISGDASDPDGLENAEGSVKVFAGLRKDPFYFNLAGFNTARQAVQGAFATLAANLQPNGCPQPGAATAGVVRDMLQADDPEADNFFQTLNTLAIVIEADRDFFVDDESPLISVYGQTYVKSE